MQWSRRVEDMLVGLAPLAHGLILSATSLTLSLALSGEPMSKIASGIFQLYSAPFALCSHWMRNFLAALARFPRKRQCQHH